MRDSTIAGNQFGAISSASSGDVTVTNSTISGNFTVSMGYNIDAVNATFLYATVVGNGTASGFVSQIHTTGDLTSFGSVFALQGHDTSCDIDGTTHSNGYNLSDDTSCGFTGTGDVENTPPELDGLADSGGSTPTRLPLAGSPLIDAIPVAACDLTTDQRGYVRPHDGGCDVGAAEFEAVPPAPTTTTTTPTTTTAAPSTTAPGPVTTAPPELPRTGSAGTPTMLLIGISAVAAGACALRSGRRRRLSG